MAATLPDRLIDPDPHELSAAAGLHHVTDDDPGWSRRRRGRGFTYVRPDGTRADRATRERLEARAVPPAWTSVWLAERDDAHLLATGRDAADRKQYRYHPRFREMCEQVKYDRLAWFPPALVALRRRVRTDLAEPPGSARFAIAAAVGLMDIAHLRVGNEQSARDGHHGTTTLLSDHALVDRHGAIVLEFRAKSGAERRVVIDRGEDPVLRRALLALADDDHERLFTWCDGDTECPVTARDVTSYIGRHAGPGFTAKDLRTWAGTATAAAARFRGADEIGAADAAADALGNTREVARSSYIHPVVLEDPQPLCVAWRSSRRSTWMSRAERSVAKVLDPSTGPG